MEGFTVIMNISPNREDAGVEELKEELWTAMNRLPDFTVDRLEVLP